MLDRLWIEISIFMFVIIAAIAINYVVLQRKTNKTKESKTKNKKVFSKDQIETQLIELQQYLDNRRREL